MWYIIYSIYSGLEVLWYFTVKLSTHKCKTLRYQKYMRGSRFVFWTLILFFVKYCMIPLLFTWDSYLNLTISSFYEIGTSKLASTRNVGVRFLHRLEKTRWDSSTLAQDLSECTSSAVFVLSLVNVSISLCLVPHLALTPTTRLEELADSAVFYSLEGERGGWLRVVYIWIFWF